MVRVKALKNQAVIADKCYVAESFFERLRGLIGRANLEGGEGMLFPRCNSIHMWFMRFSIDVVFVRRLRGTGDGGQVCFKVSSVHENVKPWRFLPLSDWGAEDTFELPAGTVRGHAIGVGDELCIN